MKAPFFRWFSISGGEFSENFGEELLRLNKHSPFQILSSAFPEHGFLPFQFHETPRGFWNAEENQKKYLNWLGSKLGLNSREDWSVVFLLDLY